MKRSLLIAGGVLAVVFALVYAYVFDVKLDLNGDNVHYLNLAKNLSEGHGYSTLMVGQGFKPASHFPPGYPFILSVFMFAGIHSLLFFKILNGIFLLASLLFLAYLVWRLTNNASLGCVVALLPMFSPHLQHFANIVMSEMSYLFFTVLCVFSLFKYDLQAQKTTSFWRNAWLYVAIVAAVATYYIRTVGASCLFAVIVFFAFRKEWKQMLVSMAGIVLLLLPWVVRNKMHGIESRYFGTIMTVNPWRPEEGTISSVGEMWDKMLKNFDETVIKGFTEALFPFVQPDYGVTSTFGEILVGIAIVAVVFFGAWYLKKMRWFLFAFLVGNIGLFMLWHGGNGLRYVVPIFPIIYLCFYTGVYTLLTLLAERLKMEKALRWIPCAFLLMIFSMFPSVKMQAKISKMPYPPAYKNYFAIAEKINDDTQYRGSVVCCRKPELFEFYAPNVYTTNYLYSKNTEEVILDLVKKRVDYVVLEQLGYSSTGLYLYPAIMNHAELFFVILQYGNPDTYLLYFDRSSAEKKLKDYEWQLAE